MLDFLLEARSLFEYTQSLRRDFHAHPELAFQELRTAGIVSRELQELGLEVTTGIAKTGVVALLEGNRPGSTLLLRFDMDALPITEETGAPYSSLNSGVMHACGHDGHTAIGLTVARLLHAHREELPGRLKFVFQPAEEAIGGAETMVAEGVLENPVPDAALALHLWNNQPLGWLGITAGPVMAACEMFTIHITGKGGHGALPHLTVDPVLASAQVITALQSIVARNVSPLDAAVVSVTSIHSGEAFNVIPPSAELQGTIRTFDSAVRELVLGRFNQVVQQVSAALGCQAAVEVQSLAPAVVNHPDITTHVKTVAQSLLPESTLADDWRTMGSEDMAFMLQRVPGCYFFVGSANSEKGLDAPHHHPRFDFDEEALPRGAALMAKAAYQFLKEHST